MDERVRVRLEGLIARLTDDPESRSALRALFVRKTAHRDRSDRSIVIA